MLDMPWKYSVILAKVTEGPFFSNKDFISFIINEHKNGECAWARSLQMLLAKG